MNLNEIAASVGIRVTSNHFEDWNINDVASLMLRKMGKANKKGANNEAEIEELEYAMDGQGDLMLALERAELWLQKHFDKS